MISKTDISLSGEIDWFFRLVSCLQRSPWNKNQFVNLLNQNELVLVHCLE